MPNKPPHKCSVYQCNVITHGRFCIKHQREEDARRAKRRGTGWTKDKRSRHERGYGSDWYRLRKEVLERDGYICRSCARQGRRTKATEVDHIIPKALNGSDRMGNLEAICLPCHKAKTVRDRKQASTLRAKQRRHKP